MTDPRTPHVTHFNDLKPHPVSWLWPAILAAGKPTLIDGDPDQGKSLLTLDLAARLTTGGSWPDGQAVDRPRSVILIGREDNLHDTVLPRLLAAGADTARVRDFRVKMQDTGRIRCPVFPEDCDLLRQTIRETEAGLVVIDPLFAFLSTSACYTSEQLVRRGLEPLTELAEETGVAVILTRHLNKGGRGLLAIARGLGGMAIVSSSRLAFPPSSWSSPTAAGSSACPTTPTPSAVTPTSPCSSSTKPPASPRN
jgi:RecA-family ATPase